MRLVRALGNLHPRGDTVVSIGTFDGVHRGHQHLLAQLVGRAQSCAAESVALTFHPHPRVVLDENMGDARGVLRDVGYLSTPEERSELMAPLGVDALVVAPFTRSTAKQTAHEFVADLVENIHMRELIVGADFGMGQNRAADASRLAQLGSRIGFVCRTVDPLLVDGRPVSSTRIREALNVGDVVEAERLLGRPYFVSGLVVRGDGRGRTLGFCTANLQIPADRALPRDGVYAVTCCIDGVHLPGVANIGVRPSFGSGARTVEVHLLDKSIDLYGSTLRTHFVRFLRPERRFEDVAQLVAQMERDVAEARRILAPAHGVCQP